MPISPDEINSSNTDYLARRMNELKERMDNLEDNNIRKFTNEELINELKRRLSK